MAEVHAIDSGDDGFRSGETVLIVANQFRAVKSSEKTRITCIVGAPVGNIMNTNARKKSLIKSDKGNISGIQVDRA